MQVVNNRMLFRCPACRAKRNFAILPSLRQKLISCHKCQASFKCLLNRRIKPREPQAGKVVLVNQENKELEVMLHDVSFGGVGFDLPFGAQKAFRLSVGSQIRFKCTWNPRLFGSQSYEIMNIIGQRVGARRS